MVRTYLPPLLMLLLLGAGGCVQDQVEFGWPRLCGPGSSDIQQRRAVRFDPYPQNEGGPSIVGARPREYDKPIPEVDRARWQQQTIPR